MIRRDFQNRLQNLEKFKRLPLDILWYNSGKERVHGDSYP